MRCYLVSFSLLLLPLFVVAQPITPFSSMNYQGVARDVNGNPIPNQTIGLRITIPFALSFAYIETQTVTTNAHGVFSILIGQGTPVGGIYPSFEAIDWNNALFWGIQVEVDPAGGTSYTAMVSGSLVMVPFAGRARTADALANNLMVAEPYSGLVHTPNTVNVGIGTPTPTANLHVAGSTRIENGSQGAGKVLTSDANGNATWSTVVTSGSYTPTWTNVAGFTTMPTTRTCEYSRVGSLVNVVCHFTGSGPNYATGSNTATITLPPGLSASSSVVSGSFNSDHYRTGTQSTTGIVANNNATSVLLRMNGATAGASPSFCNFSYRTSAP